MMKYRKIKKTMALYGWTLDNFKDLCENNYIEEKNLDENSIIKTRKSEEENQDNNNENNTRIKYNVNSFISSNFRPDLYSPLGIIAGNKYNLRRNSLPGKEKLENEEIELEEKEDDKIEENDNEEKEEKEEKSRNFSKIYSNFGREK